MGDQPQRVERRGRGPLGGESADLHPAQGVRVVGRPVVADLGLDPQHQGRDAGAQLQRAVDDALGVLALEVLGHAERQVAPHGEGRRRRRRVDGLARHRGPGDFEVRQGLGIVVDLVDPRVGIEAQQRLECRDRRQPVAEGELDLAQEEVGLGALGASDVLAGLDAGDQLAESLLGDGGAALQVAVAGASKRFSERHGRRDGLVRTRGRLRAGWRGLEGRVAGLGRAGGAVARSRVCVGEDEAQEQRDHDRLRGEVSVPGVDRHLRRPATLVDARRWNGSEIEPEPKGLQSRFCFRRIKRYN